jgi:CTP synthase
VVGKYVDLKESYKSLNEAIVHGGIANNTKVDLAWIDSETLTEANAAQALSGVDAILVPGGFGERGAEGKMIAIQHARVTQVPFFGICFGMQLAAIEFARNVCGITDATSREFQQGTSKGVGASLRAKGSRNFVVDFMEEQRTIKDKGGTMRLGSYPCTLEEGTIVRRAYGKPVIHERHRHRYEFNNKYRPLFEKNGMTLAGVCEERDLVEIIEIDTHPWFVGVQFHPEFKSRPTSPHPLFKSFVEAALHFRKTKSSSAKRSVKAVAKSVGKKAVTGGGKLKPLKKSTRNGRSTYRSEV